MFIEGPGAQLVWYQDDHGVCPPRVGEVRTDDWGNFDGQVRVYWCGVEQHHLDASWIHALIIHELGHVAGIAHQPSGIMEWDVPVQSLQPSDVAAARAVGWTCR